MPTLELVAPEAARIDRDGPRPQWWDSVPAYGVGGADVAAVLGMEDNNSALKVYMRKRAEIPRDPDNRYTRMGRRMEGVIAELFAEETGLDVRPSPGLIGHVDRPWMVAALDRLVAEPDGVIAPLECKNRSAYQDKKWGEDGDSIPDGAALQAHWYNGVTGYDHTWMAVLLGGNTFRWYRIERDQELIDLLTKQMGAFWHDHVLAGVPPEIDESAATSELLNRLWDADPGKIVQVDPLVVTPLLLRRAALKAQAKDIERQLAGVENKIKDQLREAEIGMAGAQKLVTWKRTKGFATKKFREQHPELAAEYTIPVTVDAIDVERLAEERPDLYRAFQVRSLTVPTGGK